MTDILEASVQMAVNHMTRTFSGIMYDSHRSTMLYKSETALNCTGGSPRNVKYFRSHGL